MIFLSVIGQTAGEVAFEVGLQTVCADPYHPQALTGIAAHLTWLEDEVDAAFGDSSPWPEQQAAGLAALQFFEERVKPLEMLKLIVTHAWAAYNGLARCGRCDRRSYFEKLASAVENLWKGGALSVLPGQNGRSRSS